MDYAYAILKMEKESIWRSKTPLTVIPVTPSASWITAKKRYIQQKHPHLLKRFKDIPNIEAIILCYDHINAFTNASLSVHPSIKQKWKLQYRLSHELFGAFYNTDPTSTYCTLFPELEAPRGSCNAYTFTPKKGATYLANPPYTSGWIKWTIRNILDKWRDSHWIIVIPVWDAPTRKKFGLSVQPPLVEIDELLAAVPSSKRKVEPRFLFYNGYTDKPVILHDPVHIIFCFSSTVPHPVAVGSSP
jgi:ABC-type transport system substrate-binding protein